MFPSESSSKNNHRVKELINFFEARAAKSIPLVRSTSTPLAEKKPESEENQNESDVSMDDLLVQFGETRIDDEHSPPTQLKFFTPIRNRRSSSIVDRVPDDFEALLAKKRSQMGQIKRNDRQRFGLGGGILISESHMLVTKHSFGDEDEDMTGFHIQFEYLDSKKYQIESVLSEIKAKELGLQSGLKSDLRIIKLKPDNKGYPGVNNNFTQIKEPTNKKPSMLHFMGYTSGTTLKESSMPGRPIEMTDITKRGKDAVGQLGVWNDFITKGYIVTQTPEKASTKFTIETHARTHEFSLEEQNVFRKNGSLANTKKNGLLSNPKTEFYILYPNIFHNDHVRLAHRTSGGSSGGIYFTEEGEIYAVHCGRVPSQKDYPEHIAFYPWAPNKTTIYVGRLIHETRKTTLAELLRSHLNPFKANQYILHLDDKPIGTIVAFSKPTEGNRLLIKPFDEEKEPFSFIVPYFGQDNIDINGAAYERAKIRFSFQNLRQKVTPPSELPEALYRVSLADLREGRATHEIPVAEQQELARRIVANHHISHSMTINNMRFEHTTIGSSQKKGAHYEFVRENEIIAIHARGCHRDDTSYYISKHSPTFKESAVEANQWTNNKTQNIFRL